MTNSLTLFLNSQIYEFVALLSFNLKLLCFKSFIAYPSYFFYGRGNSNVRMIM